MAISDAQYAVWLRSDAKHRALLIEAKAYSGGAEVTRYFSAHAFVSEPADTPANIPYDDIVVEVPYFTADIAEAFSGRSSAAWGDIIILNENGARDAWLADAWDGRAVALYLGDVDWPKSDFRSILTGVAADLVAFDRNRLALRFRDKSWMLDVPLQVSLIGGTTANAGRPKPFCAGPCFNIEPVLVTAATHEYQVHDGQINDITDVRDNGVTVAYTKNLANGKFTLNAAPAGRITCDVQGAKPGGVYLTKCADLVSHLLTTRTALTAADLDATSFADFNTTCPQTLGFYARDTINVVDVVDQLVGDSGVGGYWLFNAAGDMVLERLDAPPAAQDLTRDPPTVTSSTAQGGSVNTLTLDAGSPDANPGDTLTLTGGAGSVQEREIFAYDPATKVARVGGDWNATYLSLPGTAGNYASTPDNQVARNNFALRFAGVQQVQVTDNATLDITDNLTVEFWFKPNAELAGLYANHLTSKGVPGVADSQHACYFFGDVSPTENKQLVFVGSPGGVWQPISPRSTLVIGVLYHVVWRYNSATGGTLHINAVSQGAAVGAGAGALPVSAGDLYIGSDQIAPSDCTIDGYRMYSRYITDQEIAEHYAGTFNNNANLVCRLDFEQGSGVTAYDGSGNQNHGTLIGGPTWVAGIGNSKGGVVGDIDIRAKMALNDWAGSSGDGPNPVSKYKPGVNQRSFGFAVVTGGVLQFAWSVDGTSLLFAFSTVGVVFSIGTTHSVCVKFDVNNGAGGRDFRFYTSEDYDPATGSGTWTQLGATVTQAGTTSIFDSTAPVEIGAYDGGSGGLTTGKIYSVELRNGIDGPVVAKFDPLGDGGVIGGTSLVSGTGEIWTVNQSGGSPAVLAGTPDATTTYDLTQPGAYVTPLAPDLAADDVVQKGLRIKNRILPVKTYRLGYKKNWTVQTSSLAGAVTEANRAAYATDYLSVFATNSGVETAHLLAPSPDQVGTLLVVATEAQTECTRRATLWSTLRYLYVLDGFAAPFQLRLGQVAQLTHPRFGFAAGKLVRAIGLRWALSNNRAQLTLFA